MTIQFDKITRGKQDTLIQYVHIYIKTINKRKQHLIETYTNKSHVNNNKTKQNKEFGTLSCL